MNKSKLSAFLAKIVILLGAELAFWFLVIGLASVLGWSLF